MLWGKADFIFKSVQNRSRPVVCYFMTCVNCSLIKLLSLFKVGGLTKDLLFFGEKKSSEAIRNELTSLRECCSRHKWGWTRWVDDNSLAVINGSLKSFLLQEYSFCQKDLTSQKRHAMRDVMTSSLYRFTLTRGCDKKAPLRQKSRIRNTTRHNQHEQATTGFTLFSQPVNCGRNY